MQTEQEKKPRWQQQLEGGGDDSQKELDNERRMLSRLGKTAGSIHLLARYSVFVICFDTVLLD